MRFHYHRQQWLTDRRWQRFHLFWPNGRRWRGLGIVVWCHEFSLSATTDGGAS